MNKQGICKHSISIFPTEKVLAVLMRNISKEKDVQFAIIATNYFGDAGQQYASVFRNEKPVSEELVTINQALKYLGVTSKAGLDEFDTAGLDAIRSQPGFLEKYSRLADENGL